MTNRKISIILVASLLGLFIMTGCGGTENSDLNPPIDTTSTEDESVPVFSSGNSFTINAGQKTITTLLATDSDGDAISYLITGGSDSSLFEVGQFSGQLSFVNPAEPGRYSVEVSARTFLDRVPHSMIITVKDEPSSNSGSNPIVTYDPSAPITRLSVISSDSSNVQCSDFGKKLNVDLNGGAGGKYIYLCYSRVPGNEALTNLKVTSSTDAGNKCPSGYDWINKDLNEGAGGDYIYLCTTTQGNASIYNLQVTSNSQPGNRCGDKYPYRDPTDLNKGADGNYIYICYD